MSAAVISLFFAIGAGAYIFMKTFQNTNNRKTSVIVSVFVAVILFIVFFTLFNKFFGPKAVPN